MKIYDMILFAIAYILFVSSRVRAERLSMSGVASVWKRNGGSSSSCPTAVAVAWAESRGDTKARGQNSNSYDRGLWQINSYWHRDVSDSCAYDKNCNAKNAVRISSNGGKWSPWATYNDGLHKRWMNDAKKACGGSFDVMEENVGGGKVYGEYNKGPIKVGGEHNWDEDANDENVGSLKTRIVKWGAKKLIDKFMDEEESNVGGGKVYGEYNKGPIKVGGEHNWDENAAHRHNQLMHHHRQIQSNKWDEEEANVGDYRVGVEFTHKWDEMNQDTQHRQLRGRERRLSLRSQYLNLCTSQCRAGICKNRICTKYTRYKKGKMKGGFKCLKYGLDKEQCDRCQMHCVMAASKIME